MATRKKGVAPSREDLIRENEALKQKLKAIRTSRLSSNLTVAFKTLVTAVVTGLTIVYSIKYLAGQTTKVDAAIDVGGKLAEALGDLAPKWWLQLGTILVLGINWRATARYKNINKSLVTQLSEKTKRLEKALDPNRSSSGLGEDGETHDRDKL